MSCWIMYYILGFTATSLLLKLKSKECRSELLLVADDPHSFKASEYPIYTRFTCLKQADGLLFPFMTLLKIVKASEDIFKKRVFCKKKN